MSVRSIHPRRVGRTAQGSTLLEVLIAVLVLSIGLLGVSGLHAASLRYIQGGWARAAVAGGMSSFAEAVRSNPDASTTAYLFTSDYATQRSTVGALTESTACTTGTCTPNDLATEQLNNWRIALDKSMPGAAAYVTGDRSTGYQATLIWFDRTYTKLSGGAEVADKKECSTAGNETGMEARTCCPLAAAVPGGARCTTFTVVP